MSAAIQRDEMKVIVCKSIWLRVLLFSFYHRLSRFVLKSSRRNIALFFVGCRLFCVGPLSNRFTYGKKYLTSVFMYKYMVYIIYLAYCIIIIILINKIITLQCNTLRCCVSMGCNIFLPNRITNTKSVFSINALEFSNVLRRAANTSHTSNELPRSLHSWNWLS